MTKGKRIVSFILSAIMVLSSTVTGYAEGQERIGGTGDTAYVEEMSGMDEIQASGSGEKAEGDNQALSVSILEGKGKILIKGDTGFEEVVDESGLFPVQLNISEEKVLHIEVIPEKSYQVSTYRTLMDSGTVEEIVDEEILNKEESFKKDLSLKETESLEVSFKEAAEEQTESPAEPEETDPQENNEEVTGSPYDMQEVKDILNSTELDLTVTPPTEEENAECDALELFLRKESELYYKQLQEYLFVYEPEHKNAWKAPQFRV